MGGDRVRDYFPSLQDEQDRALELLGIDVNRSFHNWMMEIAPRALMLESSESEDSYVCVVCGHPLPANRTETCGRISCRDEVKELKREIQRAHRNQMRRAA